VPTPPGVADATTDGDTRDEETGGIKSEATKGEPMFVYIVLVNFLKMIFCIHII